MAPKYAFLRGFQTLNHHNFLTTLDTDLKFSGYVRYSIACRKTLKFILCAKYTLHNYIIELHNLCIIN